MTRNKSTVSQVEHPLCLAVTTPGPQSGEERSFMPANIILVHDDPEFIEEAAAALRLAAHNVVSCSGSRWRL
jgi:hypothetical protein